MSKGWRGLVQSKRWSNAGIVFLAVLAIALIAATVVQNQERKRENAAIAAQFTTSAPTTEAGQPGALFFGDSYFQADQSLAKRAGQSLGYEPVVGGFGGTGFVAARKIDPPTPNYVDQINAGALAKLDPAAIRLVVVGGGLNDLGQPDDQITKNAGIVLGKMTQTFPQAKVVLLGPVATTGTAGRDQRAVVGALAAAAKAAGVPFVDATGWVTSDNVGQVIGPDKMHPTDDGHKVLAEQLVKALRDLGLAAS